MGSMVFRKALPRHRYQASWGGHDSENDLGSNSSSITMSAGHPMLVSPVWCGRKIRSAVIDAQ